MEVVYISEQMKKFYPHLSEDDLKFIILKSEFHEEDQEIIHRHYGMETITLTKSHYLEVPKDIADIYRIDTHMDLFADKDGVYYKICEHYKLINEGNERYGRCVRCGENVRIY